MNVSCMYMCHGSVVNWTDQSGRKEGFPGIWSAIGSRDMGGIVVTFTPTTTVCPLTNLTDTKAPTSPTILSSVRQTQNIINTHFTMQMIITWIISSTIMKYHKVVSSRKTNEITCKPDTYFICLNQSDSWPKQKKQSDKVGPETIGAIASGMIKNDILI